MKYIRPTWDEYFFEVVTAIGKRATCGRGRSGCVITKDNHVVSTGYVGTLPGMPSCDDVGHLLKRTLDLDTGAEEEHCIRTIHAEQNAICQAAKMGVSIDGATLYCTMTPCAICTRLIVNSGVAHVRCLKHYHDVEQESDSIAMFEACGVYVSYMDKEVCEYEQA